LLCCPLATWTRTRTRPCMCGVHVSLQNVILTPLAVTRWHGDVQVVGATIAVVDPALPTWIVTHVSYSEPFNVTKAVKQEGCVTWDGLDENFWCVIEFLFLCMHARVLSWVSHRCGRLFAGYRRLFSCALKEHQHGTQRLDWVQSRTRRVWFLQGEACLAWMGCDISAPNASPMQAFIHLPSTRTHYYVTCRHFANLTTNQSST
jgi:hypothetical protein